MKSSRKRHTSAILLVLVVALLPGCSSPSAQPAPSSPQQAGAAANPITVDSTEEQIRRAVGTARVGRKLTPKVWPNGARVAVCLSFDVDNELLQRANPLAVPLSVGEYGATTSVPGSVSCPARSAGSGARVGSRRRRRRRPRAGRWATTRRCSTASTTPLPTRSAS